MTQYLLQLALGLLQLPQGLLLLVNGVLPFGVVQLLLRLVHALLGGFQPFSGGILRGILLLIFRLCVFALSAFPLFALALGSFGIFPLAAFILAFFPLGVLPLSVLRLLLVLLDCLRQAAGLLGNFPLLAGKLLVVVAARGSALNVLLLLHENADRLEIIAKPGLLVLERLVAILAHQQIQQGVQVLIEVGLILQRPRKLVLAEKLDEPLESHADQLLLALGHRLLEQGGAARIAGRVEFGHSQQHLFKMLVFLGNAAFLDGELFGRRGLGFLGNGGGGIGSLGFRAVLILHRLRQRGRCEA